MLREDDLLALAEPKRLVCQYVTDPEGTRVLHLFYGDKDISFEDADFFAFGEGIAAHARFRAGAATTWGAGYDWSLIRPLLETLLGEGVLVAARGEALFVVPDGGMVRRSPLPPAVCRRPRNWHECEAITRELTGQPVEVGYLELIVPVFRVAHIAVDSDGRQVGEANVFPRALRLDVPTTWLSCTYPGTRYMVDRPMNVTALKAMRLHWRQMMATLLRIREAFLRRCPDAREGWTVGRVERLATLVLAVPTYPLVRAEDPLGHGELHPVLSSLFRVTDGLRMAMHQMLFVPIGEPMLSADAAVTSASILDYAERNYSFHSETGVCGGPRHMVDEFLGVLLDGRGADGFRDVALDEPVAAALADVEAAFDYGFLGLQAYAAIFSLWPVMVRTYARLASLSERAVADGDLAFAALRDRMLVRVESVRTGTYLATEAWRTHREQVYADMYAESGRGLGRPVEMPLAERLNPAHGDDRIAVAFATLLASRFPGSDPTGPHLQALQAELVSFVLQAQAIFRTAVRAQTAVNQHLGRPQPSRPFGSAEVDVHNVLQGSDVRRVPYLFDELEHALDIRVTVDTDRVVISDRRETRDTAVRV